MRVLHLSAGNLYGGVERYLATLAGLRHLAEEMKPAFGLCFPGRARDELRAAGAEVHDLGPVRLSRPWTGLAARQRLRGVLAVGRFDAVVCHSTWPHVVFGPVVRRGRAWLVHAAHDAYTQPSRLDRWAARTRPDAVVANSHFTAGPAARLFPRSRVEVVYLPVMAHDVGDRGEVRGAVRDELGTPAGAVVILQASRLERWKGQAVHVAALGRLAGVPCWEAWFAGGAQKAGEAEFLAELGAMATQLGVAGRVRFLGQRPDVARLMAAADVYSQPNTGPEPFGLALVEALAAGLPVVTSGFGGAAEIVTEACGISTAPGDAAAVAVALHKLITNPAQRAALGANGPARARALCDPATALTALAAACRPVAQSRSWCREASTQAREASTTDELRSATERFSSSPYREVK